MRPAFAAKLCTLLFAACAACSSSSFKMAPTALDDPGKDLVLQHVTVVNTVDGHLSADTTVVIQAGKIAAMGPSASLTPPAGLQAIDANGKYLVPGYVDGHTHMFGDADSENRQALMVAHGVTSGRQMNGTPEYLEARRLNRLFTNTFTPRLLGMPGDVIMPFNVHSPEEGVELVRKQKAQGADFIKIAMTTPDTFYAVAKEAKAQGLPYEGHIPTGVDALEAVDAGFHSVEHLGPADAIFIKCSTDEANVKAEIAAHPAQPIPPLPGFMVARMLPKLLAAPFLFQLQKNPQSLERMGHVIDTYDEAKCRKVAETFASKGVWHAPTLIRLKGYQFEDDAQLMANPDMKYINRKDLQLWQDIAAEFKSTVTPAQRQIIQRLWEHQLRVVKLFDEANVPMMAGTDMGGMWQVGGLGMQQEFALLSEAGLSPLRILQMATLNPARFFNKEATLGSVATGKDADLVVLDANPLDDVRNLGRINAVVRNGAYYSRADLDARLQKLVQGPPLAAAATP